MCMGCTSALGPLCQRAAYHERISCAALTHKADLKFPIPAAISFRSWRLGRPAYHAAVMFYAAKSVCRQEGSLRKIRYVRQPARSPVVCRASMAILLCSILEGIALIDLYPHCATLDHLEQIMGCGEQFGSCARVSCERVGRITSKEPLLTRRPRPNGPTGPDALP